MINRLPIVLGITGHRLIQDKEQVKNLLREQISAAKGQYPNTPLVALTSLAEGADRLFAQIAIDMRIPFYAVLPFAAEEYQKDFPDTREDFLGLCKKAVWVFDIPLASGVTPTSLISGADSAGIENNNDRNTQYAAAGIYIAQRAHLLFAVWDGQPARALGGTEQIVQYRRLGPLQEDQGIEEALIRMDALASHSLLDDPTQGLLCHILVSGDEQQGLAPTTQSVQWWWGNKEISLPHHDPDLQKLDNYNAKINGLFPVKPENVPGAGRGIEREIERIQCKLDAADTIANQEMNVVRRSFRRIFWMAGAMVLVHELYAEVHHYPALLFLYLILLGGIGWQVRFMRRARQNAMAVDYRALAEGIRVQRAWFRAGLTDLVSQRYLRRHGQSLGWIRTALQGSSVACNAAVNACDLGEVAASWINNQKEYYADKSVPPREKSIHRFLKGSLWFFIAGIVVALLTLGLRLFTDLPESPWLIILDLLIGLFPAVAGLLSGYLEFAGYEDDVREQRQALHLFSKASDAMQQDHSIQKKQELIRQLGIEALIEQANWAILHKNHDAKTPLG